MYQALYRKYRPTTFKNVVGQDIIIKTLTNSVLNNKITHAYLFTGPRGTGKTTVAKIMAKIVNCENLHNVDPCDNCVNCTQNNFKQNTDVIEIDAASNNGVEEIRELREKVNLVPSFGKYKVYIIDEVHMLSNAAFNALLKTLEEPPKHIIFILATTEPHKIPSTILSRCQRYDFKRVNVKETRKRLDQICKKEKIKIEESAVDLIAEISNGGMRDSIGLLDQLTCYTNETITTLDVHDICGTINHEQIGKFFESILNKNITKTLELLDKYDSEGKNLNKIIEETIRFLKNLLIFNVSSKSVSEKEETIYTKISSKIEDKQIYNLIEILLQLLNSIKGTNNVKLLFELSVIKMMNQLKEEVKEKEIVYKETKVLKDKKCISSKEIDFDIVVSKKDKKDIEQLKKLRINNTLAKFDKKQFLAFKKKLGQIEELLMDPEYSSLTSLILDGELKAKGENNLIFVYKIKNLEESFNVSLNKIEEIFKKALKEEYKPIAVTIEEWECIKADFNKNIKNKIEAYKYIEEPKKIATMQTNKKKEVKTPENNKIEELFDETIVYN